MAAALTAFMVGALLGLLARPLLDAYVSWSLAKRFEAKHAALSREDGSNAQR